MNKHDYKKCGIGGFPFAINENGQDVIDTEGCSPIAIDGLLPLNFCPTCGEKL